MTKELSSFDPLPPLGTIDPEAGARFAAMGEPEDLELLVSQYPEIARVGMILATMLHEAVRDNPAISHACNSLLKALALDAGVDQPVPAQRGLRSYTRDVM